MKKILLTTFLFLTALSAHANFRMDWDDTLTGASYLNTYWVLNIGALNAAQVNIYLSVYRNKIAWVANKQPLRTFRVAVEKSSSDFDTYFSSSAMTGNGKNIFENAQNYILSLNGIQLGETSGINFTRGIVD